MLQVEKQRLDLTRELDDLTDRLEEAGGVTASQVAAYSLACKSVHANTLKVSQII